MLPTLSDMIAKPSRIGIKILVVYCLSTVFVPSYVSGTCTEFISKMSPRCIRTEIRTQIPKFYQNQFHRNYSEACANVMNGIISPQLCDSAPCGLGDKLKVLVAAAVTDFFLNVGLIIVSAAIYSDRSNKFCPRTLRFIKMAVPFIRIPLCILILLFSYLLSQVAYELESMACIEPGSLTFFKLDSLKFSNVADNGGCLFILLAVSLQLFFQTVHIGRGIYERRANALARKTYKLLSDASTTTAVPKPSSCCDEYIFKTVMRSMWARERHKPLPQNAELNSVHETDSLLPNLEQTSASESTETIEMVSPSSNAKQMVSVAASANITETASASSDWDQSIKVANTDSIEVKVIEPPSIDFEKTAMSAYVQCFFVIASAVASAAVMWIVFERIPAVNYVLTSAKKGQGSDWCQYCRDDHHEVVEDQTYFVHLSYVGKGTTLGIDILGIVSLILILINRFKEGWYKKRYHSDVYDDIL